MGKEGSNQHILELIVHDKAPNYPTIPLRNEYRQASNVLSHQDYVSARARGMSDAFALRQYFHAHSSFRNSAGQISGITSHKVGVCDSPHTSNPHCLRTGMSLVAATNSPLPFTASATSQQRPNAYSAYTVGTH